MKRSYAAFAVLLALAHFTFLMLFFAPAFSTPDAHSYFRQARSWAEEGRLDRPQHSPIEYMGTHYERSWNATYASKHAPGLALALAVPLRLFGRRACFLVNPLLASLSLLGLFVLARRWFGPKLALLATGLIALNPILNEHAHFGDAHVAVAFLLVWSLAALTSLRRRPSIPVAFAAGLLAGMLPAVRYPEAVYLPAIVIYAWSNRRRDGKDRVALLAAAAALATPILALAWRDQSTYGAFWRTGYAVSGEQAAFSLFFFLRNSPFFVQKLLGEGGGMTFALGALGIALMCADRRWRLRGAMLAGIVVPSTLLYMSYYWPPDPQSMRYLAPTFFLYALGLAWLVRRLARDASFPAPTVAIVLLTLQAWWGLPKSVRTMSRLRENDRSLAMLVDELKGSVPAGSVLVVDHRLAPFLDFAGDWRIASLDLMRRQPEEGAALPPPPGAGMISLPGEPGEEGPPMRRKAGWDVRPMGASRRTISRTKFERALSAWAAGRRVFWILDDRFAAGRAAPSGSSYVPLLSMPPGLWLVEWDQSATIAAHHGSHRRDQPAKQSPPPRDGRRRLDSRRHGLALLRHSARDRTRRLAVFA